MREGKGGEGGVSGGRMKGRCKREEKMGNYSINIYLTKNQTNLNFLPFLRRFREFARIGSCLSF